MSNIGFVLEKIRHGSELSTGEARMLADEIDRLMSNLEGCAQEVARREDADKISRQQDRDRAERLRLSEEEVGRLRDALDHEKNLREVRAIAYDDRTRLLEGMLKDIHYGLLYQPELTREELAEAIATEVTPHAKPIL